MDLTNYWFHVKNFKDFIFINIKKFFKPDKANKINTIFDFNILELKAIVSTLIIKSTSVLNQFEYWLTDKYSTTGSN